VHIVVYIFSTLFLALTIGLVFAYFRNRQIGMIFMALAYGGAAGAALVRMEWWPLVAGLVVAWIVRFAGLDPDAPRAPRK
jgi:hypothetical protein